MKNYVKIPLYTTIDEIKSKNYSLSSSQYKKFDIRNKNQKKLSELLDRELTKSDNGIEVGSDSYVDKSEYCFIKTKALQDYSYLIDELSDSGEYIKPQSFEQMNLNEGDIIISKDSNVGEVAILDKDYPKAMLCSGLYKLPIVKNKYYIFAMLKSQLFKQQIDFLVPKGATIRHGKTKFLDCLIPFPNKNIDNTIRYVELLTRAIVGKEIAIRKKYYLMMKLIDEELVKNQKNKKFVFNYPNVNEILELDRMDAAVFSKEFKEKQFLVYNYKGGHKTIFELGFDISRGQNLQISNIGISIQTKIHKKGFYTLMFPNFLSKYGTINEIEYLGNPNQLKTLKKGDIIFGAEGNEKGRSIVILKDEENTVTNIHGITLNQNSDNMSKSIFCKCFLDWYRSKGMIDAYAVGGNGGSMAIKYWNFLKFPCFDENVEKSIIKIYSNASIYDIKNIRLNDFEKYDVNFNQNAGIHEIDSSLKMLQELLDDTISNIADDIEVRCNFAIKNKNT